MKNKFPVSLIQRRPHQMLDGAADVEDIDFKLVKNLKLKKRLSRYGRQSTIAM